MPAWAAFRSLARPCSLTWSTRCLIEVCALDAGTSAMPAATGFKSMIVQDRKPRDGHREGMIRTIYRIQPAESMLLCMSFNSVRRYYTLANGGPGRENNQEMGQRL